MWEISGKIVVILFVCFLSFDASSAKSVMLQVEQSSGANSLPKNGSMPQDQAMAKAKGIKNCILTYKDYPDANEQIPKCILSQFSGEIELSKTKLEAYLKN